ncbi:helix-turn-helix transcriptional regulator [Chitinophaga sp.]|uniref:helix-turn-helix domain-containing protein n=1 Tax=Chitinophaga sp. TaxID=1869181 RepID=UPI0031D1C778
MEDSKEILKQLGANIKAIREKKNLTQLDIEVKAGVYASDLSKIENGNTNPSFTKLVRLAKVLGVQLNELYTLKTTE